MCAKVDCKDHTPEQRKVVEDFDKLIETKLRNPHDAAYERARDVVLETVPGTDQPTRYIQTNDNGE